MKGAVRGIVVADIIENEKFRFRPKISGVANACALQISFSFFGHTTWIAIVRFSRDRILDRTNKTERRFDVKHVDPGSCRIRYNQHVAGVNSSPTTDAGAVKAQAFSKDILAVLLQSRG